MTTISQTAFYLVYTQLINLFSIFSLLRMLPVAAFVSANLAMETFVFLSVFIMTYKCFQIMDARNGQSLNATDYFKLIGRKFLRLAVPYYMMWLIFWSLTPRIASGSIYHNSDVTYETCQETWVYSVFFIGNLVPAEMDPYRGCYQQAFPLQLDMQISLVVPVLAILAYKAPRMTVVLSILLIAANMAVNIYYT